MEEVGLVQEMHMGGLVLVYFNFRKCGKPKRHNQTEKTLTLSRDIGAYTLERNFIIPLTTASLLHD